MPSKARPKVNPTPTYVQMGVSRRGLRAFSGAVRPGAGSGRLRVSARASKPGRVFACGSLGSISGTMIGAAGAAACVGGGPDPAAGGITAGPGTSTLRAPVFRSTLPVSVRAESPSDVGAGAPGSAARVSGVRRSARNPSGASGAGTPKIVLVALDRCAANGDGV